jgi:hypothetical protein
VKTKLLVTILALGMVCVWVSSGLSGEVGYRFKEDKEFGIKPTPGAPSSGVVAADAIIGRPLGLATTIAGAGVFLVTLPFSGISGSTQEAGWGLVGRPAGWTFVRPLGRSTPLYEERGIFGN